MWRVFTIAKDKSNLESRNLGLASLGFPADKGREARRAVSHAYRAAQQKRLGKAPRGGRML